MCAERSIGNSMARADVSSNWRILGIACSVTIIAVSGHLIMLWTYNLALSPKQFEQFMLLLLHGWWAYALPIILGNFAVWTTVVDIFIQRRRIDRRSLETAALILLFAVVAVPYYWWQELITKQR